MLALLYVDEAQNVNVNLLISVRTAQNDRYTEND